MDAVRDFLLEYYVWVLAVLVILLITVIGFLADTKKKRNMREKVMKEKANEVNGGDMVMEQNNVMNQNMDMNNNTNMNGYDIPSGNNNVNEMNDNSMNNNVNNMNNESYFVPSSMQTPSIEPVDVPNVMSTNMNMGNVNSPVVEQIPTPNVFQMPTDNVINAMAPNNADMNVMPNNEVINNMPNSVPVQEPLFNSSMNNNMVNNAGQLNNTIDNITMPVMGQNPAYESPMPNLNPNPFMNNALGDNNLNNVMSSGSILQNTAMNNGPVMASPMPMPEANSNPATVMPNISEPVPTQPIMNGAPVVNMNPSFNGQPVNPMMQNPNMVNNQPNQFNNGQFNN